MRSFVLFKVNQQFFAVDIESVKRILSSAKLTDIPDEPSHIEGMFQYEGEVLKVLSFRKLLGLQELNSNDKAHEQCLIIHGKEENFGLNIDSVEDIIYVKDETLHKPTQEQSLGDFMQVEAILDYENHLVTIVKNIRLYKTKPL